MVKCIYCHGVVLNVHIVAWIVTVTYCLSWSGLCRGRTLPYPLSVELLEEREQKKEEGLQWPFKYLGILVSAVEKFSSDIICLRISLSVYLSFNSCPSLIPSWAVVAGNDCKIQ